MNALQLSEIKNRAKKHSLFNPDRRIFVLVKNGTSLGHITCDPEIVRIYVTKHNYSVYAIYVNGQQIDFDPFVAVWEK